MSSNIASTNNDSSSKSNVPKSCTNQHHEVLIMTRPTSSTNEVKVSSTLVLVLVVVLLGLVFGSIVAVDVVLVLASLFEDTLGGVLPILLGLVAVSGGIVLRDGLEDLGNTERARSGLLVTGADAVWVIGVVVTGVFLNNGGAARLGGILLVY